MAFFVEMKFFLVVFIVFGLWCSWENSKNKIVLRIFSIVSIALVLVPLSLAIFFKRFYETDTLPNTISSSVLVFFFITHSIIILESIFQAESQNRLIQNFTSVDNLFIFELGIQIPYQKEKWQVFYRALILVIIDIFVLFLIHLARVYYDFVYSYFYFSVYANLIICLRSVEVLFFMHLLQTRQKLINKELSDIRLIEMLSSVVLCDYFEMNETNAISNNAFKTMSINKRISSLKLIYAELFEICKQIGQIFGWSLLIIVIHACVFFTAQFYWPYIQMWNMLRYSLDIIFTFPILIALGTLAFYCSSCYDQVRIIHRFDLKLLNTFKFYSLVLLRDGYIEFQSIQQIHQKTILFGNFLYMFSIHDLYYR